MKTFSNRFDVRCVTCKAAVPSGQGFTTCENGPTGRAVFTNYCRDHLPHRIAQPASNGLRVLTADGKVIMPYEPANIPLVKSLPGARFNPADKSWQVSLAPADRRRVLEVADKIGLEVAPNLRVVELSEEAESAKAAGLYDYQVEGVNWMSQKRKCILGDEMGLGKSAQVLLSLPKGGAMLVVCRVGLKPMWRNECQKWRKDLRPVVLSGRGSFRFPRSGEVVIINPQILPDEFKGRPTKGKGESTDAYFLRLNQWRDQMKVEHPDSVNTHCVVDEAHDYKNRKAAMTKKVREIAFLCGKVTGLTGSPLANRPEDLFGVLDTIGVAKDVFGTYDKFKALFNAHFNGWGVVYGKPNPIVPELLRRVMIRRLRRDVLAQLPNKVYTNLVVDSADADLKARLDALWQDWESSLTIEDSLPDFREFAKVRADLAQSRIPALIEYVEDCEEQECPILVFSSHLAPLDALLVRDGWAVICGDTKPERRQQIVDEFQAGRLKGVGISIRAGGVGLTLTRAAKAVFVDLDWSPAANAQAEDRICRIGQTRPTVEIVRMVSDHVLDLHIQNMLTDKMDTTFKAIDALMGGEKKDGNANPNRGETEEEFAERMQKLAEFEAQQAQRQQEQTKADAKSKVAGIHEREKTRYGQRPLLPLTPERSEQVRSAFRHMLGVCDGAVLRDGVGFNKPDAAVAHCLLTAGLEDQRELEAGQMILSRYHRQLSEQYPILFRNG